MLKVCYLTKVHHVDGGVVAGTGVGACVVTVLVQEGVLGLYLEGEVERNAEQRTDDVSSRYHC